MSKATMRAAPRNGGARAAGANAFFCEPEFDFEDLMQVERDGRGLVSVLELQDVQDRPALSRPS